MTGSIPSSSRPVASPGWIASAQYAQPSVSYTQYLPTGEPMAFHSSIVRTVASCVCLTEWLSSAAV